MRFLIFGLVVVAGVLIIGCILGKKALDSYLVYYRLGQSCFDKESRTFNDVLDRDVIASDEISKLNLMGYTKGKQDARTKFLIAQKRYEDHIKSPE